jgi:hypothetical protein
MTKDEAIGLKSFTHYCTCGGYAWRTNGRPEAQPHMTWCPQYNEYSEWYDAIHSEGKANESNRH